MAILVTGGAGYIGSHTCVELLNSGEEIIVLDNFSNSKPDVIRRISELTGKTFPVYAMDLLYDTGLEKLFANEKIDCVIHFAGLKAVGESVKIPIDYYHNNITGTLNLCKYMQKFGCKKIVFSSSATVYGMSLDVPFKEDAPLSTTNPYGSTKLMIENILRDIFVSDNQWSIALLRYFNPIGAHKSGLLGESPNGIPNNLLPYVSQVAVGKLKELHVFGDDYPTIDGTGVRDYLHVLDLAKGHVDAVDYVRKNTICDAINLGTGVGYSVLQVIKAYEDACNKEIPYVIDPRRPGDIATCFADATKAKQKLGWQATRSIGEMCEDSWKFTTTNPNGI